MVTIKQALTNTHGVSIRRTIKDIKVGEAFKWKDGMPHFYNGTRSTEWCVKLKTGPDLHTRRLENGAWVTKEYVWCHIEGNLAGRIFYDEGNEEVHQP